jgi:hypothetical protein
MEVAMVLDERLVKRAQDAEAQLNNAERAVASARAELHTTIRLLHLAGGSLREIAEALRLSHQRVQQIVNEAGGSWWTRVWRTRQAKHELVCTFCDRAASELTNLLAGPDVFICDDCVGAADRAIARGSASSPALARSKAGSKATCSFCRKRAGASRALAVGEASSICEGCIEVCRAILRERGNPRA